MTMKMRKKKNDEVLFVVDFVVVDFVVEDFSSANDEKQDNH